MNNAASTIHKFELAGLGKAPYRFVGVTEHKFQACQGEPVKAGASCDFCGSAIMYAANVISADGRRFKVGCDCALSIGDKGLRTKVAAWQRAHDAEKREAAKARKVARATTEHAALLVDLDTMAQQAGFAGSFASSVARHIRNGKTPSAKQLAVIEKLRVECDAR